MNNHLIHSLTEVAERTQIPFYLFDTDVFRNQLRHIKDEVWGCADLCFAMKCNPFLMPAAAEIVDRIEVCSYGEYCICRSKKIPAEQLLISGVLKKTQELETIIEETGGRARFTAESMIQFALLKKIAEKKRMKLRVYLRLTSGNQFGFDRDELIQVLHQGEESDDLEILGIHYYSGSQKRKPEKVAREIQKLDEFLMDLSEKDQIHIPELEYGPGIPADYFTDQAMNPEEAFLEQIRKAITEMSWEGHVTLEMGRTLAASCGYYMTKIWDIKHSDGIHYCITDGGIHQLNYDGQIRGMYHPYMKVLRDGQTVEVEDGESLTKWTVCGSLCTANDVLCAEMPLGDLRIGDALVFERTGAYCMVEGMALFLSHELPEIYTCSEADGIRQLRGTVECWELNTDR